MANQKGTSSHDTLRGTIYNDLIEGLGGDDHLHGLDGNDILRGGDGYDVLTGDTGNDTLDGGALDDWFYGGVGNDVLTGGTGADRFVFETTLNASSNVDTITDFATGSDKIWLNASIFNKLTVNGALDASMLRIGSAAADSNDHIIYNRDTGALIYDSNGNAAGGAVQFATIGKGLNLTANDFNVFGAPTSTPTAPTPTNPVPTAPAGVVTKVGSGSDTLTLKISQDAYQGDSQYAVYVDGKQIGGTFTAKALHNSGQFDTLEVKGDWGVGNHTVSVKLLNDLYGGSATADRNVYVESATYNGSAVSGSYQYVNGSDAKSFTVADSTAVPSASIPTPTPTPTPVPTPADPVGGIKLTKTTTPIKSSYAGQVIENKDIWVENGNAVSITHDNVILKNCRIYHKTGDGVNITNAKGVQILNCEVINMDPPSGFNGETDTSIINIEAYRAYGLRIDNVTLRDGATGILINESPNAVMTNIEGYNFHGGFPRGQFVQFGFSDGSRLTNFYTKSDLYNSRTEDNINVYHSNNVTIENGVVDGNNSPSGVGVLFEGDSGGGIVRNVDVVRQSNGGFSSYSANVDFFDVRVFDGYNTDIGRGKAMSNGLSFASMASGVGYDDATYTRPANSGNIFWGSHAAEFLDIRQDAAAVAMDHSQWVHKWNWII